MKKLSGISIMLLMFLYACNIKPKEDLSAVQLNITINRLDKDFFSLDYDHIADSVPILKKKYGEALDLYTTKVIHIGKSNNPMFPEMLKNFITDFTMNEVYTEVNKTFPSMDSIKQVLTPAFKRFHIAFPDKNVPRLFTYISGFNQSMVSSDTILGIGLDKYLGPKHDFYQKLSLPLYIRYNMYPGKIPADCIKAWLMTQFEMKDSASNLLSNMIYQGKILYMTKQLLPEVPDSIIIGFTQQKINWCLKNEDPMWTYLVEHKAIFISDYLTINRFIGDGPFTKDFTAQSPGRAATWIGWRIIESFMKKNHDITPAKLMSMNDPQEILRKSRYRP
jgi:hypothetical protein